MEIFFFSTDNGTSSIHDDFEVDISETVVDLTSLSAGHVKSSDQNTYTTTTAAVPNETNFIRLKGSTTTQSRCFICHSKNGRKAVPWPAIQQAWFETRCYIPKTNRSCEEHLTVSNKFNDDALRMIADSKIDVNVNISDFKVWLNRVSDFPKSTPYNFEEDGIEAEKYKMFLGISKENFDDLLTYVKGS